MTISIKSLSAKALSVVLVLSVLVGMISIGAFSASAATVVPTTLVRQNLAKWKNYTYGDPVNGTLYRTGCGIFSIVNAVGYLTGNTLSVTEVAAWGHSIGGYNPGTSHAGTYRTTLYPKLQAKYGKRYGFTVDCGSSNDGYWAGASSSTLKNHLKNGGVAIGHVPGHFIAVVGYDPNTNYFHVYDSYPTSARGTGSGDAWVTQSRLSTGKLKLDWFCLLTSTGTVINNQNVSAGYSVTFDSRGGSAVSKQTVTEGGYAKNPGAPTRENFEFLGWYDENGWEFLFDSTAIWADRTLHAEWKAVQWPQSTNYMPSHTNTAVEDYTAGGDSYVWPYYNGYTGAVTMYKGGADYGWPSMLTTYQTSVDLSKTAYLNVSVTADAQFNADIFFHDMYGTMQSVRLSQIVNGNDSDFAPGNYTIRANVGNYLYNHFSMPADGIVNIDSIRYFVIGEQDTYASLNNVIFTGDQLHTGAMDPETITQEAAAGATGSYTYENGILTINGTGGYAVSFNPNVSFNPSELPYWITSIAAEANFDITMIVTTSEGDRRVSLMDDFYPQFGYDAHPEIGLAPGQFTKAVDLLSMYTWNNVLPADGVSTIKKVTLELRSNGGVTMSACQVSNAPIEYFFTDSVTKSGSWEGNITIDNADYVLNTDNDVILSKLPGLTANQAKNGMNNAQYIQMFDGDTAVTDATAAKTGLTIKVVNGDVLLSEYTFALLGDVNGTGDISTADVRDVLLHTITDGILSAAEQVAADADGDADISTKDARALMIMLLNN